VALIQTLFSKKQKEMVVRSQPSQLGVSALHYYMKKKQRITTPKKKQPPLELPFPPFLLAQWRTLQAT